MADNCAIFLLGAMDRLWFHQIILCSEPTSVLPKPLQTSQPISEPLSGILSNVCNRPLNPEDNISLASPVITSSPPQNDSSIQDCNDDKKETEVNERPTRLQPITNNSRSKSPLTQKRAESLGSNPDGGKRKLQKTMSCKSLLELELEEVKGFMDLGFEFSKEHISPRIMNVLPGLQRLIVTRKGQVDSEEEEEEEEDEEDEDDDDDEEEEEVRGVVRPYLSEAWLIKRPNSPLLNLRLPTASKALDMKKHLRYWARTVASVIRQES